MNSAAASILTGHLNEVAWLKVIGKGCFLNSPDLKALALKELEEGFSHLVLDLKDCCSMDSTFMGTLVKISNDATDQPGGKLEVVHLNERNHDSLCNLGLDYVLEIDPAGEKWVGKEDAIASCLKDKDGVSVKPCKELVLEAHEALCDLNAENEAEFHDVVDSLKQDLEAAEK